jgi:hypothetical protein
MPEISSTLRVYIATVPGQMDGERAVLEGLVLPELRARGEELGLALELVDPMKERGEDWEWDLGKRFREIDACRPLFLAFLDERYGDPPRVVPADLVAAHPWLAEDPGRSVTELEILHGALRDPANAAGGFFYLRDPRFPAAVPDQHRGRFLPESGRAAARLAALKDRIRSSGRPVLDGYPCSWSDSLERASRLEALAERLVDDLWPVLQDLARRAQAKPALPMPEVPPYDYDPNATVAAAPADPAPAEEE